MLRGSLRDAWRYISASCRSAGLFGGADPRAAIEEVSL